MPSKFILVKNSRGIRVWSLHHSTILTEYTDLAPKQRRPGQHSSPCGCVLLLRHRPLSAPRRPKHRSGCTRTAGVTPMDRGRWPRQASRSLPARGGENFPILSNNDIPAVLSCLQSLQEDFPPNPHNLLMETMKATTRGKVWFVQPRLSDASQEKNARRRWEQSSTHPTNIPLSLQGELPKKWLALCLAALRELLHFHLSQQPMAMSLTAQWGAAWWATFFSSFCTTQHRYGYIVLRKKTYLYSLLGLFRFTEPEQLLQPDETEETLLTSRGMHKTR